MGLEGGHAVGSPKNERCAKVIVSGEARRSNPFPFRWKKKRLMIIIIIIIILLLLRKSGNLVGLVLVSTHFVHLKEVRFFGETRTRQVTLYQNQIELLICIL